MNGILLVNKEAGVTSRDVVNNVCKILGTKEVGHTGTLDPIASGVLVLCVGSATKLVEIITSTEKEYKAEMILGIETDTLDTTGRVLRREQINKDKEDIEEVLNSMVGTYNQEVPVYSAVKINGKKLYEYARNNEEVILPKRQVNIKSINLDKIERVDGLIKIIFTTTVSKGTYIRSLIRDIASKLGTVGIMCNLIRTRQGKYSLDECYSLEDIKSGNYKFLSINSCLDEFDKIVIDGNLLHAISNGALITNRWNKDKVLFIDSNNNLIALYKTYEKDNTMLKPWKMLKNSDNLNK